MIGFGFILLLGGAGMFGVGVNMIVSAASANLLSMGLAMILGIGGTVVFAAGAVVLAVAHRAEQSHVVERVIERVVDDTTGPIPIIEERG